MLLAEKSRGGFRVNNRPRDLLLPPFFKGGL
jgi:hypothetical protein